ncbi:hypothetical protein JIN84_06970 [Luteolibacter yonseiensis]|uniref:DUF5362 domain-containing protein n=1 Tax=Luteolibacter yonseiensis TaxID=1144680 RepID=A0A934V9N7_9BACT|nr:DUF5362 family protein [Luteolibacter yonseiensis]MBK1815348.1 hypothetical protein [Luteolibacter yonseiensis]
MSLDPYSSPVANSVPGSLSSGNAITQGIIEQLARTKPWVRFISVMVFIGAGLMVLLALVTMLIGIPANSNPMFGKGLGFGFGGIYLLFAGVYIYPGIKLWKYASRIGDLVRSGSVMDLEGALNEQRSFWKFLGIAMLVILSLYVLIIVAAIVITSFGVMAAKGM